MTLAAQTRLGPYEILAPIGAGGMGTVYKARDTRLDRIVAIKVAQEKFSERFDREARAVAALNHPHICALYDVGPDYLVMEYIDGRPLSGPLSLDQSMKYAAQICDALDAAHRKGVVHRDLKPGNILVTKLGVKLLDFGLARIESSHGDDTTFNSKLTQTGAVMGTPAYMAPEQWEGKSGDARSDIYAFGCVLYEMLTGKRAAEGRRDVEPATVESVLRVCLERDPEDRWQSAHDMRRALQVLASPSAPVRSRWRERIIWVSAVAIALAVALFLAMRSGSQPVSDAFVRRLIINLPPKTVFSHTTYASVGAPELATSPDGRFIVFAAVTPGANPTLWLRPLDSVEARSLEGTDGAEFPFWSPDGRWIGFFADGRLKKIPSQGGPVVEITPNAPEHRGASWGPDETILFGSGTGGVSRAPSSGGMVTRVTQRDRSREEGSHRFPQWLPDGQHFLYTVRSSLSEQAGVYAGSLDGKTKKLVLRGITNAQYTLPGYILFMDRDTLMAQAFDADQLETRGQPFPIETHVGRSSLGNGSFSASFGGLLAFAGPLSQTGTLTWFDRSGRFQEPVGNEGDYTDFRLSPDQTKLAFSSNEAQTGFPDIWLTDLTRRVPARFTFGPALNAGAVWSPDSARIIFRTSRSGVVELYSKSAGGGGKEEPVLLEDVARTYVGEGSTNMELWDTDGRNLLFGLLGLGQWHLWTFPLAGDPKPVKFLETTGHQVHANFSPDGKLVAYSSNESGRWEIHVQTFPLSDNQWTISNGGYEPRWRADGREIYYLSEDRKLMAVTVNPGPSFAAPRELFQTRVTAGVDLYRMHYVPNRDGSRFLVNTQSGDPPQTPITVVLNWTQGLKKQ